MQKLKTTINDIIADAARTAWKQALRSAARELNKIADAA